MIQVRSNSLWFRGRYEVLVELQILCSLVDGTVGDRFELSVVVAMAMVMGLMYTMVVDE